MATRKPVRIEVHFLPQLGLPNLVLETTGKAGYAIHADTETQITYPLGYRVWTDSTTYLLPALHVLYIQMDS